MAIDRIVSEVDLDIYNHDQAVPVIKAISGDSVVRYVRANLFLSGENFTINDSEVVVKLCALRPDRSLVIGLAEYTINTVMVSPEYVPTYEELEDDEGETYIQWYYIDQLGNRIDVENGDTIPAVYETTYELYAEMTKEMLDVPGITKMQFKVTSGSQELRTSIFNVNVGENLENKGNCIIDLTAE